MPDNKLVEAKKKNEPAKPATKPMSSTEPITTVVKPVDNKLRQDWNDYLAFLDKKGIRGNPSLDVNGVGYKLFDEYVKNNPQTLLSRTSLKDIKNEMVNYRQWVLNEAKAGRATLSNGTNETNFMKNVIDNEKTKDPIYPGSYLTSTPFPSGYIKNFENGQLKKTEIIPFVSTTTTL